MLVYLGLQTLGQLALLQVVAAGVRRDREAARNRDPERRHLGEPGAFAAEELLASLGRLIEVEDVPPAHRWRESFHEQRDYASPFLTGGR